MVYKRYLVVHCWCRVKLPPSRCTFCVPHWQPYTSLQCHFVQSRIRRVRVCLAAGLEHTTFRSQILRCTTELSPLPGVAAITDLISLPVLCGVVFYVLLAVQSLWKSGHVTFNLRSDISAFCSLPQSHTLMSLYKCRIERSDGESLPNPASEEGRGRGWGGGGSGAWEGGFWGWGEGVNMFNAE